MSQLAALSAIDAAYADLEDFLAADPAAIEPRHYRACLLGLLGKREQAQAAFLELLEHDPKHFGVLNDFGTFLFSAGLRKAAVVALAEAVKWHPGNALGHTNLACLYVAEGEMDSARRHFDIALQLDPWNPMAHEGLAVVLARQGDEEAAKKHRTTVVAKRRAIKPLEYTGKPVRVLLVESAIGGNVFAHDLLADLAFEKKQVFLEFLDAGIPLPEHDLVFNAIGDAERCGNLLRAAPHVFARTRAPIVNAVEAVQNTTRRQIAARLSGLKDVVTPRVFNLPREELIEHGEQDVVTQLGLQYPVLLRSPGFHTGEHFVRVDAAEELANAAAQLPGRSLLMIEFLDARNGDGKIRKYRVVIVDGRLYPLHVAISENWKVHYFSADMSENAAHRREDEAFLLDMPSVLGAKALDALTAVRDLLGLDYGGVDFTLDSQGRIIVFEANATMIVPEPEEDARWQYRLPHVQRIYDAVRTMLVRAASSGS
jgi:hypothetical protein